LSLLHAADSAGYPAVFIARFWCTLYTMSCRGVLYWHYYDGVCKL